MLVRKAHERLDDSFSYHPGFVYSKKFFTFAEINQAMDQTTRYGIGEQDFKSLRERGCVYIDKTRFIDSIITSGSKYYFLARPRRFGKSLFLSTLQYFFEGRRDLFKDLFIESTEWDWQPYPVFRLDLNTERYAGDKNLDEVIDRIFREWEAKYEIEVKDKSITQRFATIIATAHERTGRQVVILVDEYDKPLVGNLNKNENYELYRDKLAALYSNFKSGAEHIRLVFLTGVSRFSKLSVFSDLNNLKDITFSNEFADICGITEKELLSNLNEGIKKLALTNSTSYDEALTELKKNYDGYRFAEKGSDIYNPWSLLNCLDESKIGYYWNNTGLPTIIMEALRRIDANLEESLDIYCSADDLKGMDLLNPNPTALMYQTGYLTIKDYLHDTQEYLLGIPNNEVKKGFFTCLLPYYVNCKGVTPKQVVATIIRGFIQGKPETAMKGLQTYFAGITYRLKMDNENNFHNAFFLLTDLIGLSTAAEVNTSNGSIDLLISTPKFIYVIELKYDHSAEEALRQIENNLYARPYQTDSRKLFKIGVSFSSKTRCIENWIIAED